MDDRWEKDVTEFGAINITGFRVLDVSRKMVQNFIELWRSDSISVSYLLTILEAVGQGHKGVIVT